MYNHTSSDDVWLVTHATPFKKTLFLKNISVKRYIHRNKLGLRNQVSLKFRYLNDHVLRKINRSHELNGA